MRKKGEEQKGSVPGEENEVRKFSPTQGGPAREGKKISEFGGGGATGFRGSTGKRRNALFWDKKRTLASPPVHKKSGKKNSSLEI